MRPLGVVRPEATGHPLKHVLGHPWGGDAKAPLPVQPPKGGGQAFVGAKIVGGIVRGGFGGGDGGGVGGLGGYFGVPLRTGDSNKTPGRPSSAGTSGDCSAERETFRKRLLGETLSRDLDSSGRNRK